MVGVFTQETFGTNRPARIVFPISTEGFILSNTICVTKINYNNNNEYVLYLQKSQVKLHFFLVYLEYETMLCFLIGDKYFVDKLLLLSAD